MPRVSTERLARFSARRPWLVIALWAAMAVAGLAGTATIGGVLNTDQKMYVENDSQQADRLLAEKLPGAPEQELIVIQSATRTVDDPAFRSIVDGLVASARALSNEVHSVTSFYESGAPALVSADGRTTLVPVTLHGDVNKSVLPLIDVVHKADGVDGFTVVIGGKGSINDAFTKASESDLASAEVFGLPVALVVLVLVFGALVAAGLPLLLGVFSIIIAIGVTALVGRVVPLSVFALNVITTMGFAVGIDYSLIIVQRFREERRLGLDRDQAIARTGATANRAVLFSGLTVIVALCGLLIIPTNIYRSLAFGAIVVVVAAIAAALTLLPALLHLLDNRVNKLSLRLPRIRRSARSNEPGAFWSRTTDFVMRHAALSVIVSVSVLLAASAPYLGIRLGSSGVGVLPHETDASRAFAILDREFNAGMLSLTNIVVSAADVRHPSIEAGITALQEELAADSAFGAPNVQVNEAGDLALVAVPIKGDSQARVALDAIARLRHTYIPAAFNNTAAEVHVSGQTASTIDFQSIIDDYTPIVFAFVLGLSFVILLMVFQSLVVPLKAVVMNLLSVGASYGIVVLVFQHGYGHQLFGFQRVDRIEAWVPLFMFAITFGLSMDYHVFLLSRIRERFTEARDNAAAVAFGVRTTAGMITGAALIMVAVFGGMATGQLTMFQQMGFGLAVAVAIDATLVRTILVPASMALLGDLNWYLPSWLGWLPKIDVDGSSHVAAGSKA